MAGAWRLCTSRWSDLLFHRSPAGGRFPRWTPFSTAAATVRSAAEILAGAQDAVARSPTAPVAVAAAAEGARLARARPGRAGVAVDDSELAKFSKFNRVAHRVSHRLAYIVIAVIVTLSAYDRGYRAAVADTFFGSGAGRGEVTTFERV